jgi:hypothetical protein
MSARSTRRLAAAAALGIGAITVVSAIFLFGLNRRLTYGNDVVLWAIFSATAIAYAAAGYAIITRSTSQVIGWMCFLVGGALELSLLLSMYGIYAIGIAPGSLPAAALALTFAEPVPVFVLGGIALILLLFPTGHPVSARWRWAVWLTVAATALLATRMIDPHTITSVWSDELSHAGVSAVDPLGIPALHGFASAVAPVGGLLLAIASVAAVVSLFVRRRRATPDERQQIRWLAAVGARSATGSSRCCCRSISRGSASAQSRSAPSRR